MPYGKNPFVSNEENTIDPNENNPVLKTEDPAKSAEEDGQQIADDFEYVDVEAAEGEKQSQDDAILEDDVQLKITEIDNIVKDSDTKAEVIQAMASVATEMFAIVAERGKLGTADLLVAHGAMASFESAFPDLKEVEGGLVSLESYKNETLQFTNSQVSLEGIGEKINTALNNFGLNIERMFKNGVGLANSITPLINHQLARASKLKSTLNGAHRDAGQKEVSGGFTKNLAIESKMPDPEHVVKQATYLNECVSQLISDSSIKAAVGYIQQAQKLVDEAIKVGDDFEHSSAALKLALLLFISQNKLSGTVIHQVHRWITKEKTAKQFKLNGELAPELFKVYPAVAKIRDSEMNEPDDALEYMKSLPLFGNRYISVSQYKQTLSQGLDFHFKPGIELSKSGGKVAGTMRSLNASQQNKVLDQAIALLTTSKQYYANYAQRNQMAMTAYQKAFKGTMGALRDIRGFKQSVTRQVAMQLYGEYTRMYWNGIFSEQSKIANYARTTATALLDLVEASSEKAQGGSPSQEAKVVETEEVNPFLA